MNDFLNLMRPELAVTVIIFLLLFIKIGKGLSNGSMLLLIQVLLLINLGLGFVSTEEGALFGGLYKTTLLISFQKNLLNLGLFLISLLFADWFKKSEHLAEYFMLMLSSLLGMFFLISSGNLLMFYLSLELASIPVAAMANFDLHKKISSEAAMKMILSSAFSSGILLFGISLVYGATGSISFDELPLLINSSSMHIMAFVFLFAAFAFKLSIVPFHLWTADVYQGSPAATSAFLSVISKGAFTFIFITALYKVFQPISAVWFNLIMLVSIVTMLVGNLFALRQQNVKRFLAFSSIAQVGFILVGISSNSPVGASAVVYFVLIYIFSNLAAFAVAGTIESQAGKTTVDDYKGLYQTNPFLCWMMALALFSLAGVPPTAGFFGKLFLITAGAQQANYLFVIVVALNLVISLYYYLRIVRAMFMDKNEAPVQKLSLEFSTKLGLIICAAGIVVTGLVSWIYDYIQLLS
jgi:NADH-quinone oxidoreductase subunit N